jgi:hypothetical protein
MELPSAGRLWSCRASWVPCAGRDSRFSCFALGSRVAQVHEFFIRNHVRTKMVGYQGARWIAVF